MSPHGKTSFCATNLEFRADVIFDVFAKCKFGEECMEQVKFAIPAGSLAKATFEILQRAGYKVSGQERTYRPTINDRAD